jgi:hypothetical protein
MFAPAGDTIKALSTRVRAEPVYYYYHYSGDLAAILQNLFAQAKFVFSFQLMGYLRCWYSRILKYPDRYIRTTKRLPLLDVVGADVVLAHRSLPQGLR